MRNIGEWTSYIGDACVHSYCDEGMALMVAKYTSIGDLTAAFCLLALIFLGAFTKYNFLVKLIIFLSTIGLLSQGFASSIVWGENALPDYKEYFFWAFKDLALQLAAFAVAADYFLKRRSG